MLLWLHLALLRKGFVEEVSSSHFQAAISLSITTATLTTRELREVSNMGSWVLLSLEGLDGKLKCTESQGSTPRELHPAGEGRGSVFSHLGTEMAKHAARG